MSDIHRGSGNNYDNFLKNHLIYDYALDNYYQKGYTYIELGDGDEMWEVKNYGEIINAHKNTFDIIKKMNKNKKLIMLYGNHDIEKKDILPIPIYESIILKYEEYELFLLHGHQVDFFNSTLWKLARFLVRHIWKRLEHLGFKDPTSAAKNYKVSKKTEKALRKWSNKNQKIVISGHTHRPLFPKPGKGTYFNAGSCIHPDGITCIEIKCGMISLVKWSYKLKNNSIIIGKSIIEQKMNLKEYYKI